MARSKRGGQPQSMFDLLSKYDLDKKKYISQEWQDYAYRLAVVLDDLKHKSYHRRLPGEKQSPAIYVEVKRNQRREKMIGFFDQVYRLVKQVPTGKVVSYGQIAQKLGSRDARKVGWALHSN